MPKKSPNIVRLIGGELRRRQISFPDAIGLRPTSNRVRETLFNWLGQDLTGKICLDLFAGSGALGFEAASRHAKRVIMVEIAKPVHLYLQQNQARLHLQEKVELQCQSAFTYLAQNQTLFDIIFLDPPFDSDLIQQILPLLPTHLAPHGKVYLEARQLPTLLSGAWLKRGKAGEAYFGLATLTV